MRTIRIMTVEEQDFAALNHDLILEFLDRKRLSMEFYYDVVVFGYLSAVQQYFRNPPARPEEAEIVCLLLGYTTAEAALELGVPESAAYERMRSFRRRVRAAIG